MPVFEVARVDVVARVDELESQGFRVQSVTNAGEGLMLILAYRGPGRPAKETR